MIECIYGEYHVYCDICSEEPNDPYNTWNEAQNAIKENGYKTIRKDGDWQHICPECQEL